MTRRYRHMGQKPNAEGEFYFYEIFSWGPSHIQLSVSQHGQEQEQFY